MLLKAGRLYEFGPFRLDTAEWLLCRDGQRVELTPKALELLVLLLENSGHLVTKDELREKIWPDTFVEDSNFTFNITAIRRALGDDRHNGNRFIETVPKRGYRFTGPVRVTEPESEAPQPAVQQPLEPSAAPGPPGARPRASRSDQGKALPARRWHLYTALVLTAAALVAYWLARPLPPPRITAYHQLTHDHLKKLTAPVSDGLRVYFTEETGAGPAIRSVSSLGGEVAPIPTPFNDALVEGISPDRQRLLLRRSFGLWWLPLPAGSPELWPIVSSAGTATWSRGGATLVFSKGGELYRAKGDGSEPRKLAEVPGNIQWPRIAPDGNVVRFTVAGPGGSPYSLWEVHADGTHLQHLFSKWSVNQYCGDWTPDGRYFVFATVHDVQATNEGQLWAMREKGSLWSRVSSKPVQLTHSSVSFSFPTVAPDGHQIFALGYQKTGELSRYDRGLREFAPYLDGISALWVSFSRDGRKIAYERYPDATLWVANQDGSGARQLTFVPMAVDGVALSPDGTQIAYRAREPGKPWKIFLISAEGSESKGRQMDPDDTREEGVPTWSPDGARIAFGDVPQFFGNDDGTHAIRVFDLQARTLSSLPGSQGLWTARWSPDGHYLAALTMSRQWLQLFDCAERRWRDLRVQYVNNLNWSHDSQYIYFDREGPEEPSGIWRVRVPDGTLEHVAAFGRIGRAAGWWSGLAPDDSPLILRDIGTEEIYALDVDWP